MPKVQIDLSEEEHKLVKRAAEIEKRPLRYQVVAGVVRDAKRVIAKAEEPKQSEG